jgi:hypothetical protein
MIPRDKSRHARYVPRLAFRQMGPGPFLNRTVGETATMRRLSNNVSPALLLLLLAWLQGCQWMQSRKSTAAGQPAQTGVEVGQVAPDIDGDDLNGQHLRLADYRGQVVVLTFWSKT